MVKYSPAHRVVVKSHAGLLLFACGSAVAQTHQERVHEMSHSVMPFDMAKTVHIFKMTESGGVQRVIVTDKSYADRSNSFNNISERKPVAFSAATMQTRRTFTEPICRG